jgi:hypothetical protein
MTARCQKWVVGFAINEDKALKSHLLSRLEHVVFQVVIGMDAITLETTNETGWEPQI